MFCFRGKSANKKGSGKTKGFDYSSSEGSEDGGYGGSLIGRWQRSTSNTPTTSQ